jgi:hypothetical protein
VHGYDQEPRQDAEIADHVEHAIRSFDALDVGLVAVQDPPTRLMGNPVAELNAFLERGNKYAAGIRNRRQERAHPDAPDPVDQV